MATQYKYPRTFQLPWSDSNSSDDVWWTNTEHLNGVEVVVTEKIDGENTNLLPDRTHARSLDSGPHPSRTWIRRFHGEIAHEIPEGYRICGENVFAYHSIFYTNLPTYFFVFGIYNQDKCLAWDETLEYCSLLGLKTVPIIYRGPWDEKLIRSLWQGKGAFPTFDHPDTMKPVPAEGYVVRPVRAFGYNEFSQWCAKYVRKGHVTTDANWMNQIVRPNLLLESTNEETTNG